MKVKELIKELLNCNMEDRVTISMQYAPDGRSYVAAVDNIATDDRHPAILVNPLRFHHKEDEEYNPVETTLENTLHAVMKKPTDDGSYNDLIEDYYGNKT